MTNPEFLPAFEALEQIKQGQAACELAIQADYNTGRRLFYALETALAIRFGAVEPDGGPYIDLNQKRPTFEYFQEECERRQTTVPSRILAMIHADESEAETRVVIPMRFSKAVIGTVDYRAAQKPVSGDGNRTVVKRRMGDRKFITNPHLEEIAPLTGPQTTFSDLGIMRAARAGGRLGGHRF